MLHACHTPRKKSFGAARAFLKSAIATTQSELCFDIVDIPPNAPDAWTFSRCLTCGCIEAQCMLCGHVVVAGAEASHTEITKKLVFHVTAAHYPADKVKDDAAVLTIREAAFQCTTTLHDAVNKVETRANFISAHCDELHPVLFWAKTHEQLCSYLDALQARLTTMDGAYKRLQETRSVQHAEETYKMVEKAWEVAMQIDHAFRKEAAQRKKTVARFPCFQESENKYFTRVRPLLASQAPVLTAPRDHISLLHYKDHRAFQVVVSERVNRDAGRAMDSDVWYAEAQSAAASAQLAAAAGCALFKRSFPPPPAERPVAEMLTELEEVPSPLADGDWLPGAW